MSASPPSLSSSATPSPRRGSTTWSNGPPRWAGRATRSASSTPTSACRARRLGQRDGFESLVAEVALGQVGIILALEVSRLARDNTAWYRLLDLAGACDTLVADADGVYHPGLFNDRLVLGHEGHHERGRAARAARPADRRDPQQGRPRRAAHAACRSGWSGARPTDRSGCTPTRRSPASSPRSSTASRCAGRCAPPGCGCASRVCAGRCRPPDTSARRPSGDHLGRAHLPRRAHHADPPRLCRRLRLRPHPPAPLPRQRRSACAARQRRLPPRRVGGPDHRSPSRVHRLGHLPGQPGPHRRQHPPAGPRAGHRRGPGGLRAAAGPGHLRQLRPQARRVLPGPGQVHARLLLPRLGRAGRRPRRPTHAASAARPSTPRSPRRSWPRCSPPRCRPAWPPPSNSKPATTPPWPSTGARSNRPATTPARAERRYRAVDPDNRLVARGLETEWNTALQRLADAEAELARREAARPKTLTDAGEGHDPGARRRPRPRVVGARPPPTRTASSCCTPCSRKSTSRVHRDDTDPRAELVLRWNGGAISELTVPLRRPPTQDPHRRGHHRPAPPARRALPRRAASPGSSTANTAAPPADCRTPPVGSNRCDTTGRSPATSPATSRRKESCST